MTSIDLALLPKPRIIEEISYETTVSRQNSRFAQVWADTRTANPDVDLPDYDVQMLQTDPAILINQAESSREVRLRQRANEVARGQLLGFATGPDLDHLAAFYDVERLPGELDPRLKLRVILAIQGRSTGGTAERYKYMAMTSSLHVSDVVVYRSGKSPVIHVAVFSDAPDGVASASLLATVTAALQAEDAKVLNDTFAVSTAVRTVVNIVADVWLLPDAAADTLTLAESELRAAWMMEQTLGRDLISTWWVSKLMIAGVHKITPITPLGDVEVPSGEAASIGSVTLNLRGRAF